MKKTIFLLLASVLIISCSSDEDNNNNSAYALSTGVEFRVSSPTGIDLLDPANANAYLEESIKIYYLQNGAVNEVYNSNLSLSRNFDIVSPEDSGDSLYFMRIFLNNLEKENAITYIEWNEADSDTLRANFRTGKGYTFLSKTWFNDVLIFDENTTIQSLPEIIKN